MISPVLKGGSSAAASVEECLRSSLACQLACIACVDAGLKMTPFEPISKVVRACLSCLDACMLLGTASLFTRSAAKELVAYSLNCIDACATCEAECREFTGDELLVWRCGVACRRLRECCGWLLDAGVHAPALSG